MAEQVGSQTELGRLRSFRCHDGGPIEPLLELRQLRFNVGHQRRFSHGELGGDGSPEPRAVAGLSGAVCVSGGKNPFHGQQQRQIGRMFPMQALSSSKKSSVRRASYRYLSPRSRLNTRVEDIRRKHPAGTARAEARSAVSLREVPGVRHGGEPVKLRLIWSRPTCFLSSDHQPRPTESRGGREGEEELSGHAGCRFSRFRHPELSLPRGRNLLALGTAVLAAHYPGTGPACWHRDQPIATRHHRVRAQLNLAAVWAPTTTEKDAILEAMQEQQDWEDSPPPSMAGRRGLSALTNAACCVAAEGSSDCPGEVATNETDCNNLPYHIISPPSSSHHVHGSTIASELTASAPRRKLGRQPAAELLRPEHRPH